MALRSPASKIVSPSPAPTDQTRLDQFNRLEIEALWKPPEALKVIVGIIRGLGDADARVRLRHAALRGGDIGTPFEQLGGNADRSGRRAGAERLRGDGEGGRRFADQEGNRVLKLGAQNAQIGGLRLGGFKLGLGLRDVLVGSDAGLEADLGQIE